MGSRKKRNTHLLHAGCNESAIAGEKLLENQTSPVTTPRRLHLGEHPFVGAERSRVMEVDGVVQTDHHANLSLWLGVLLHAILQLAYPLQIMLIQELDALEILVVHGKQLLQHVFVDARLCVALAHGSIAPELMDAGNGADEVAVGHVGEGSEVGFVAASGRDGASGLHPLPGLLGMGMRRVVYGLSVTVAQTKGGRPTVQDLDPLALEGARGSTTIVQVVLAFNGPRHVGHLDGMLEDLVAGAVLAHEADGGGEDDVASLARLHRPRGEGLARAHLLDVVYDGDLRVAGEHEVAVHGMHGEVGVDRLLGGGQRLRNGGAAKDAAGARRVP